jgi:hypothetical protein
MIWGKYKQNANPLCKVFAVEKIAHIWGNSKCDGRKRSVIMQIVKSTLGALCNPHSLNVRGTWNRMGLYSHDYVTLYGKRDFTKVLMFLN